MNIYVRELFEGETIKEDILEKNLSSQDAKLKLDDYFKSELKKWFDGRFYKSVETGCEYNKHSWYYFWAIPIGHDRCLRVGIKE